MSIQTWLEEFKYSTNNIKQYTLHQWTSLAGYNLQQHHIYIKEKNCVKMFPYLTDDSDNIVLVKLKICLYYQNKELFPICVHCPIYQQHKRSCEKAMTYYKNTLDSSQMIDIISSTKF